MTSSTEHTPVQVSSWNPDVFRALEHLATSGNAQSLVPALLKCFTAWTQLGCLFDAAVGQVQSMLGLILSHILCEDAGKTLACCLDDHPAAYTVINWLQGCHLLQGQQWLLELL